MDPRDFRVQLLLAVGGAPAASLSRFLSGVKDGVGGGAGPPPSSSCLLVRLLDCYAGPDKVAGLGKVPQRRLEILNVRGVVAGIEFRS